MAVINQILHRKNSSGTYDTVYLKANLANVTGTLGISNGGTGASDAATARSNLGVVNYSHPTSKQCNYSYTHPSTKQCDAAAGTHSHGNITSSGAITATGVTIANGDAITIVDSSASGKLVKSSITFDGSTTTQALTKKGTWATFNNYTHPSTKQCNYNVDLSNYYTKSEVDAMTDGPVTPISAPSSHTPGQTITWDNKSWLVCHYDSNKNQVYLIVKDIIDNCFGYSASSQTPAIQYEKYNMSKGALLQCVPVTNHSITSKVFIPTYDQMNGGFSWFNSDSRRIAQYQGTAIAYWTSSAYSSKSMWSIYTDGSLKYDYYGLSNSLGFRPCVCVQL